jgi:hypothetical protein
MLSRKVATGIAVLISFMWSVNLIVGYLYPDRSDPYVNAIFGTIVGAVFVLTRKRRGQAGSGEPEALDEAPSDEEDAV